MCVCVCVAFTSALIGLVFRKPIYIYMHTYCVYIYKSQVGCIPPPPPPWRTVSLSLLHGMVQPLAPVVCADFDLQLCQLTTLLLLGAW
jgi:hypothetical protein